MLVLNRFTPFCTMGCSHSNNVTESDEDELKEIYKDIALLDAIIDRCDPNRCWKIIKLSKYQTDDCIKLN